MKQNKEYQQFELSCGLRPSASRLLQWIVRRSRKPGINLIEIDLRVFNQWIGKYRDKPYDRKTIKEAFWQLDEKTKGMIIVEKSYTWAIHKVIVRPLEMVLQKNSQTGEKPLKVKRGNPMFSEEHKQRLVKQQQQDISKMDSMYQAVGLKFDRAALVRLYRYANKSIDDIQKSIELLLYRVSKGAEEIGNPFGFVVSCLKERWIDTFDLYYSPEIPKFESVRDIGNFVSQVVKGVKPHPE